MTVHWNVTIFKKKKEKIFYGYNKFYGNSLIINNFCLTDLHLTIPNFSTKTNCIVSMRSLTMTVHRNVGIYILEDSMVMVILMLGPFVGKFKIYKKNYFMVITSFMVIH